MNVSHIQKNTLKRLVIAVSVCMVLLIFNVDFASAKPPFKSLWDNYPNGTSEAVSKSIGGKVEVNFQNNIFKNTCVIRASRAFNNSGEAIPGPTEAEKYGMQVVSGDDKKWYAYRVLEFQKYMIAKYGKPTISVRGTGTTATPPELKGKKGVIAFVVKGWNDATGHFDIWDGSSCKYKCDYFDKAERVDLWEF